MADKNTQNKIPAWLQLYLAKNSPPTGPAVGVNPVGRPSRTIPAKRTTIWLTAGDRKIISDWQDYLGELTGKSISIGETIALLVRICHERLTELGGAESFESITDLSVALIGSEPEELMTSNNQDN